MRKFHGHFLAFALFCSSFIGWQPVEAASNSKPADLIFKNGSVYTVDEKRSWAEAVAVKDGEILYVGNDEGVAAYKGTDTRVIDLKGKMLLPGFIDSHNHAKTPLIRKAERLSAILKQESRQAFCTNFLPKTL